MPCSVPFRQEQTWNIRDSRKRLEQPFPDSLPFTDHANIKIAVPQKKRIVRSDFRSAQDNPALRQGVTQLLAEEQGPFHIPLVTAHPYHIWLSIRNEAQDGLIATIGHHRVRDELTIHPLSEGDGFQVSGCQRDVLTAKEKIVALDRKLKQKDLHGVENSLGLEMLFHLAEVDHS